jgi:hypothetical protein
VQTAGGGSSYNASDVWLMTHPYVFSAVEESEVEFSATFA